MEVFAVTVPVAAVCLVDISQREGAMRGVLCVFGTGCSVAVNEGTAGEAFRQMLDRYRMVARTDEQLLTLSPEQTCFLYQRAPEGTVENAGLIRQDRMRQCVFDHIWSHGHWIGSATKYGGDLLVYKERPSTHIHAAWIVEFTSSELCDRELRRRYRVACSVNKTWVFCDTRQAEVAYCFILAQESHRVFVCTASVLS